MKEIKLTFKKTYISLAGNPEGKEIFKNQIKPYIQDEEKIKLIFPPEIENVASSFFQGLFEEELEKIGKKRVESKYTLVFENENLDYSIKEAID
ncbi:STAS-like domain-containing protein [Streptococcus mitis]|jgi:hypothetical protein|uniref:Uncharacterized protein n=1 Tax=Streptococcus mitis TaxID=28037 RepID=A0A3R9JXB5_STRMT|nr:DUF4325 domain-containing protein [Streptococcus mitis]RSI85951.1 hypothetical protein D8853_05715 [Streptococcus mitis]RSI89949.1 hypothetical protein D8848_07085 [Streptococcus mitis]